MPHPGLAAAQVYAAAHSAPAHFRIAILYDQVRAARRAMDRLGKITNILADELDFQICVWRLDVLAIEIVFPRRVTTTYAGDLHRRAVAQTPVLTSILNQRIAGSPGVHW